MRTFRTLSLAFLSLLTIHCSAHNPAASTDRNRRESQLARYGVTEAGAEVRDQWFWDQRSYPTGRIPLEVHRAEVQEELMTVTTSASPAAGWENIGPMPLRDIPYGDFGSRQNSSGRLLTVAVHPTNPSIILVGASQGGIWKSTDRGATFRPVGENALPTLAVNVIRFDPGNDNIIYAGTGEPHGSITLHGAGLVRSTDGGETWTALPASGAGWNFEYAAITGLTFDPRASNVMYVSTSTIAHRIERPAQPESGVFKSTDAGFTWTRVYTAVRHNVFNTPAPSAGVMDLEIGGPLAPDTLLATEWYGGVIKSTDAGATWRRVTPAKSTGIGTFPAKVASVDYYVFQTATFKRLNVIPSDPVVSDFRRIELAVAPSNPSIVYAGVDATNLQLDANGNGKFDLQEPRITMGLLFKSIDGGESWTWLGSWRDGTPDHCRTQCYFDNVVVVNPADANDVIVAGMANYEAWWPEPLQNPTKLLELPWRGMVYRTRDGGDNWLDTTPHCTSIKTQPRNDPDADYPVYSCEQFDASRTIHPDSHAAAFAGDGAIYIANDGGLYRASEVQDANLNLYHRWENVNNSLSTLQFYRVDSHPTDPTKVVGGMQDNSVGYWNGEVWDGWGAGDGTVGMFDPANPATVYIGSQFSIHRHDTGGTNDLFDGSWKIGMFSSAVTKLHEPVSFVPVATLDPVVTTTIYATTDRALYRSDDRGDHWYRITDTNFDGAPLTISVSPADRNLVWIGTSTGHVYRVDFTPTAERRRGARRTTYPIRHAEITDMTGSLPNRSVSKVLAGYGDSKLVYVLLTGYEANTPGEPGRVFVSRDRGISWQSISTGLPDVPASTLAIDPDNPMKLWIGTDIGIFTTDNGGTTWRSERENMPVVTVMDMHYNRGTGYLVAATHGRGIWRKQLRAAAAGK